MLGITATESVLVGVLGTVTGVAAGYGLLAWLTATIGPSRLNRWGSPLCSVELTGFGRRELGWLK